MRSWVANLSVLAVTGLVFVGASEVILRTFPSFLSEEARLRLHWREVAGADAPAARTVNDPDIGFLYKANDRGTISRGDFSFVYNTDSNGFRNPTAEVVAADVIVLGDSMAFGYGVQDDQTWVAKLREEHADLDIYNLGMIGAAPQQYVRILERFGLSLNPELVVLVLFPGNDMADAQKFQNWIDQGRPMPFLDWEAQTGSEENVLRTVLDVSYLAVFLRSAMRSLNSELSNTTLALENGAQLELAPTVYYRQAAIAQARGEAFQVVMESMRQARALTESLGSELLILLMPTKEEVYLPTIDRSAPQLTAPFRTELEQEGFNVVDLTAPLIDAAADGEVLFFPIDGHPNARGYERIASIVEPMLMVEK